MTLQTFFQKNLIEKKDYLLELLKKAYGNDLMAAVLFGSVARGDFATYSDIDILIVLNKSNITFKKRIDEFYKKIGYYFEEHFLSPIVLTVEDLDVFHSFYLGIFENYITLYDKAGLINKVVSVIKEKIDNGEILEHSYPKKYWRILYAKDEISR